MDDTNFLDEPATKGDVFTILILVSGTFVALFLCPFVANSIDNFIPMFNQLGGELPAMTVFTLRYGWVFSGFIPPLLCVGTWVCYFKCNNVKLSLGLSIGTLVTSLMILGLIVLSIFLPIMEAEKALTAGAY